jgi:hypothetical protein
MTKLKLAVATAALLATTGLTFAQESTAPAPQAPAAQDQANCPAPGSVPDAEMPANCKVTGTTEQPKTDSGAATTTTPAQPAPGESTATTTPADQPATTTKPGDTAGMSVPAGSFLASRFIGQIVYSGADENVGEINDIVVGKDKGAVFAVVGVGGFLGIGEKDVAVPMDQIQVNKDANNNMKLVITLSREQLEASPAFDRTAALGE